MLVQAQNRINTDKNIKPGANLRQKKRTADMNTTFTRAYDLTSPSFRTDGWKRYAFDDREEIGQI